MSTVQLQERPFILDSAATRKTGVDLSKLESVVGNVTSLRVIEGQSESAIQEILSEGSNAKDFGKAALAILTNVSDPEALSFTLQLVEDALIANLPKHAEKLFGTEADLLSPEQHNGLKLQVSPFVKLTKHSDSYVKCKAMYVSALLLSVGSVTPDQETERKALVGSICDDLISRNAPLACTQSALQAMSVALRTPALRSLFNERSGATMLLELMERCFSTLGGDSQYHAVLCLWLICFNQQAVSSVNQVGLTTLVSLLRGEPRSRVVRVVLSTLRLVLSVEGRQKELCESLIELKLPKLLAQIKGKKSITDPELQEDIEWLEETLSRNFQVLTTFARHEQELLTEKLTWSMIHEEIFWKENALKFQHNNFSSVQRLVDLLRKSDDARTLAVACSDVGYFVQYYPNGKLIVEKYGGKQEVMNLLSHESPEVQKHALAACSKIMVTNWDTFKASA